MEHQKFEVAGSLKATMNATEAYLASRKTITLSWTELIEAICLYSHKKGAEENNAVGFKISEKQIIILFDR